MSDEARAEAERRKAHLAQMYTSFEETLEELREAVRGRRVLERALLEHDERTRVIQDRQRDICRAIDLIAHRRGAYREAPADLRIYNDEETNEWAKQRLASSPTTAQR